MDPRAKNTPEKTGELHIYFSDTPGSSAGVKFAATTPAQAVALMRVCGSSLGYGTGTVVTSAGLRDTPDKSSDGGDNMEKRLTVLETDVSHIKKDVGELKSDVSVLVDKFQSLDKNMATAVTKLDVKLDAITESLANKPSIDAVENRISKAQLSVILWVPSIITAIAAIITGFYKLVVFLDK